MGFAYLWQDFRNQWYGFYSLELIFLFFMSNRFEAGDELILEDTGEKVVVGDTGGQWVVAVVGRLAAKAT